MDIQAKERGLWNFFLPESERGAGLTNVDYAHIAEVTGRRRRIVGRTTTATTTRATPAILVRCHRCCGANTSVVRSVRATRRKASPTGGAWGRCNHQQRKSHTDIAVQGGLTARTRCTG